MSDLALTKVSETSNAITFSYPAVVGAEGYAYYADGQRVSRTFDPTKVTVKFSKGATSYRVVPLDVSERVDGFVWPAPTDPSDPPADAYVYSQGAALLTSPWNPTTFFNGSNNAQASYAAVNDPLGQRGQVVRLRCPYVPSGGPPISTSYSSNQLQQAAVHITPAHAHAARGDDTWYRADFMVPSGNVFCNGFSNFMVEWHTQATGPKSSGLFAFGNYPLTTGGTQAARLVFVLRGGDINNPTQRFFTPSGNFATVEETWASAPVVRTNEWQKAIWRMKWSADPAQAVSEMWINNTPWFSVTGRANHFTAASEIFSYAAYNYRYHVTGNSDIFYAAMAVGPSRASVGG